MNNHIMIVIIAAKAVLIAIAETVRDDEVDLFQDSLLRQESADPLNGNPV